MKTFWLKTFVGGPLDGRIDGPWDPNSTPNLWVRLPPAHEHVGIPVEQFDPLGNRPIKAVVPEGGTIERAIYRQRSRMILDILDMQFVVVAYDACDDYDSAEARLQPIVNARIQAWARERLTAAPHSSDPTPTCPTISRAVLALEVAAQRVYRGEYDGVVARLQDAAVAMEQVREQNRALREALARAQKTPPAKMPDDERGLLDRLLNEILSDDRLPAGDFSDLGLVALLASRAGDMGISPASPLAYVNAVDRAVATGRLLMIVDRDVVSYRLPPKGAPDA